MGILLAATTILAALLYGVAWMLAVRGQGTASTAVAGGAASNAVLDLGPLDRPAPTAMDSLGTGLMILGLVSHGIAVALSIRAPMLGEPGVHGIRFGFALSLSSVLWLGVLILCVEGFRMRLEALRVLVLPIAALVALLPLFFPGADHSALSDRPMFVPHLFLGTIAIGVLVMAAMHALLMMMAERVLHAGDLAAPAWMSRWFAQMPPLMALERILFRFIFVGFLLLTVTVGSGVLFSEEVFGRALRLDHKSVFSIAAWVLFGVLLVGRYRWGWRGRTAWRLTLSGVVILLLGYVGSRFVLEVILKRY